MRLTINDTKLIPALHKGEPGAFEAVYHHFVRPIRYFVEQMVKDGDVAQDITIETFTKAFKKNTDFQTVEKLKAFLYTAANNAALDYLKMQDRHKRAHEEISYLAESQMDNAELAYMRTEATLAIYEAIEALPMRPRQVIYMLFVEGKKLPEIASELKISYNTVQVYRARGLDLLKVQLLRNKLLCAAVLSVGFAVPGSC